MTQQLWTAGDIAMELGISASLVSNWGYPGRRQVPAPYARTQRGVRMWDSEQAAKIIADYRAWRIQRDNQRADKERADRFLASISGPR